MGDQRFETLLEMFREITACSCGGIVLSEDNPRDGTIGFRCDGGRRCIYYWDAKRTISLVHKDLKRSDLLQVYFQTQRGRQLLAEGLTRDHQGLTAEPEEP